MAHLSNAVVHGELDVYEKTNMSNSLKVDSNKIETNNKIVLSIESYGTSLPSSGTEGQIFFLLAD